VSQLAYWLTVQEYITPFLKQYYSGWIATWAAALRWAETSGLSPDDAGLSYPREQEYLTLARIRIAQGREKPSEPFLDDALASLERLLADAQAKGRMHSVLEILALKALALQGRGDLPAALDTLAWALSLAAPQGYVRLFLDEGLPMLTLLSQVGATDPSLQDYVQKLLAHAHVAPSTPSASSLDTERSNAAALAEGQTMTPEQALAAQEQTMVSASGSTGQSTSPIKSQATYSDGLTAREVQVLRLLAAGLTDAQIAEQLVISPRTVNSHLKAIYSKLGVSSRSAATRYAMEHQLV
jgi:LuxR family transcriptional regulator, maltose regulon positive regulatory protein